MSAEPVRARVLVIVQNTSLPRDRRVWQEATSLVAAGYGVAAVCPKLNGFNRSVETIDGVTIHRFWLPFTARGPLGFAFESVWCFLRTAVLTARIRFLGDGFDVLHVCNPPDTYWPLALVARGLGARVVFDHHDLSPEMYRAKFGDRGRLALRFLQLSEHLTFRAANIVLAANESYKEVATTRGRRCSDDVHVVRSAPALDRCPSTTRSPRPGRGRRPVIAYIGEISDQDGLDHLIRAVEILRDRFGRTDIECLVIGDGPHLASIEAYARELGVSHLCTFTGWLSDDEWYPRLASADIGVEPIPRNDYSDKSTMNKILDYMCVGLPIVAYDLEEHRRSAGDAAVYAQPNLESDLAARIDGLLDDVDRRREMGEIGRRRFRDGLSWEHSAAVLLSAYDDLVAAETPSPPS